MVPMMLLVLGVFLYSAASRYIEAEGKPPKWMKVIWVALGLSVLFGLQRFMFTKDILYAQTLVTGRIRYSHHAGLILPLIVTIGIGIREYVRKRADSERLY
jgi:hypothetical protein